MNVILNVKIKQNYVKGNALETRCFLKTNIVINNNHNVIVLVINVHKSNNQFVELIIKLIITNVMPNAIKFILNPLEIVLASMEFLEVMDSD